MGDFNMDLKSLSLEELIALLKAVNDSGAQYYIDLAKSKGWW